ncbi:hypothetical protein RND71_003683 [Anisodus tanguticus]|uniref:F-box domain-containing protein n=1 Tax=Anisodus tanguticus TaxID=243964 RepID=A0AAE1SYB5_9SOLA|nr:hypothetical protein RND71_003683 [Anisodus tanguticus]
MAGGDRLSILPEPIILHILSMLLDGKEVVRTSLLSRQWRFLWMSSGIDPVEKSDSGRAKTSYGSGRPEKRKK